MKPLLMIVIGSIMIFVFTDICRADLLTTDELIYINQQQQYQNEMLERARDQQRYYDEQIRYQQKQERDAFYDRQFEEYKEAIEEFDFDR